MSPQMKKKISSRIPHESTNERKILGAGFHMNPRMKENIPKTPKILKTAKTQKTAKTIKTPKVAKTTKTNKTTKKQKTIETF